MNKISEIVIGGKKVIVRELTVRKVAALIEKMEVQERPTDLDWMFADDYMPQFVLEEITETATDSLITDEITPSELEPLYQEACRLNPFLAKALKQMREIGSLMRGLAAMMPDGSGPPPST